jgi:eukaryotic-like serine/threonine-protein kinase
MIIRQGTRLGHYEILSAIGAGGMGEVYLALDTRLDRQVALKVLPREFASDSDRMRRFVQEAKAASALNHPGIITIFEIGEEEGTPFIVTEFIEGETLRHHLQTSSLTRRGAVDVALQVASALATAHEAGIVHRDVKPENLMIRPDGVVKVLDFGLAKLTGKARSTSDPEATLAKQFTDPGTVMGTVNYMSPEQARGKNVDARTDIFSLGIVLYEMLAGRTPFPGESSADVLSAILDKDPPPISRFVDELSPEMNRIVTTTLRKDRDERYQTMKGLLSDLKELRDELALEAKLERSGRSAPGSNGENQKTLIAQAQTADEQPAQPTTSGASAAPSAVAGSEPTVTGFSGNRRAIAASMVVLLVAGVAFVYWWLTRPAMAKPIGAIAVMPFVNASGSADIDYLSDGMTETLIRSLSQLPNLSVKARSTVFRYKGKDTNAKTIGRELGVPAILNGRLVQRADQLFVSLELIDTETENVIWSEQYDRRQSDLVSLQGEIARDVSSKLKMKLAGTDEQKLAKTYTANPEAYQHYLRGRFYWNKRNGENLRKAIEQFKAAADIDPGYALAYSGLADCYVVLPTYSLTISAQTLPFALTYATRAVEIDPSLGEAYASLALVRSLSWKFEEAESAYKRAIALNESYPTAHHWYSRLLRATGRLDQASAEINRARDLDPLSLVIMNNVAEIFIDRGQWREAEEQLRRILELDPTFFVAHQTLAVCYAKQGRLDQALSSAETAVAQSNRANGPLALLGYAKARSGRPNAANSELNELATRYSRKEADGRDLAIVYAGYHDRDKVFEWLEKSFAAHSHSSAILPLEQLLTPFHDDPRWNNLLRRTGLLPSQGATR